MEALLQYGSDADSSDEEELSDQAPPAKRCKSAAGAGSPYASPPAALPARQQSCHLPSAAALLDGTYSPPPAAQQRALEQAALHQGRVRAFPHRVGSFATHVYIEVETPPRCRAALASLLQLLQARLPSLQPVVHASSSSGGSGGGQGAAPPACPPPALEAQQMYHISLSRTVPLRLDQIEPLVEGLRRRLRQQDTFCIRMGRPEVLVNDEHTRTFLALAAGAAGDASHGAAGSSSGAAGDGIDACAGAAGASDAAAAAAADVSAGESATRELSGRREPHQMAQLLVQPQPPLEAGEQQGQGQQQQQRQQQQQQHDHHERQQQYSPRLVALCHAVSAVFAAHGLPRFYDDPRPHASVAWLLGDEEQQLEQALADVQVQAAAEQLVAHAWHLCPAVIVCKAGQRAHTVWAAE